MTDTHSTAGQRAAGTDHYTSGSRAVGATGTHAPGSHVTENATGSSAMGSSATGTQATATHATVSSTTSGTRGASDRGSSRRLQVHPSGWATIVAFVLLLALALMWGWADAAALAVLALIVLVIGLLLALRPVNISVRVHTESTRIVVGRVAVAELIVTAGTRGSPPTVVDLPVGHLVATFLVPKLGAGEEWREPFLIPTQRRQVLQLGPATAVRSDALGLFSRDTRLSRREEIFVHPATVLSNYDATGLLRDLEGVQSTTLATSDVAFHALRDYVPGDDRRHVHWPTVARTGTLMVRQFEETRRSHHLVLVDVRESSYGAALADAGELALSIGASYGVEALTLERDLNMRCGMRELPLGTPVRLLDAVSTVEFEPAEQTLRQLVHAGVQAAPQLSAVTIVTGTEVSREEVAIALRAVPLSATPQIIRADASGAPIRRQIEGAAEFTCSELSHLHRITRAVSA